MRADNSDVRRSPATTPRRRRDAHRNGSALLWAIICLVTVTLLAVAATLLSSGEALINDNFDQGDRALYLADEALSVFYAGFTAGGNLNLPTIESIEVDTILGEVDTTLVYGAYTGSNLKVTDVTLGDAWVRITPSKLMQSQFGDVYLLEAQSAIPSLLTTRPTAVRRLRTYATLVPPIALYAALNAPNGLVGTSKGSGRLELDGGKKGKCGSGTSIPSLAAPEGSLDLQNKTGTSRVKVDSAGVGIDSSTTSYDQLKDSLHVDWAMLTNDATYAGVTNSIVIPRDYATLQNVPWKSYSKTGLWPTIMVHGNVVLTTDLSGFGMLVVDGQLTINHGVLKWNGLVMTGQALIVNDAPAKGHTHISGAVATGLNCSSASLKANTCRDILNGEHLGVTYAQCDVQAAWAGLLTLRPLTPSRHVRGY